MNAQILKNVYLKGTVARDFCCKLRLWGVRGPTDVTHPLLTSVHCPFNVLRAFKVSKTDGILLKDTHALSERACPNYPARVSE